MRAIEILSFAGGVAKKCGVQIAGLFRKVNPDVWREVAFVSTISFSLLIPKREAIEDRGADAFIPVVLVHGLGGNRGSWWPLRLFLKLNGHRRIYAFGFESGTVEEIAANLKLFVVDVMRATGESRVDIVAHSLGGVVSRYAIQRLGLAGAVRTFVTLASPHRGTYAAHWANTDLTIAIRPDSALIRDLNSDDLAAYPMHFITIHSDRDVYIVPRESATHPDAHNIFIPGISHSQYLISPMIFRLVSGCLKPAERPALVGYVA
jgi:triacylglycerol lipase